MNPAALGVLILISLIATAIPGVTRNLTIMNDSLIMIGGDVILSGAALGLIGLLFTFLWQLNRERPSYVSGLRNAKRTNRKDCDFSN